MMQSTKTKNAKFQTEYRIIPNAGQIIIKILSLLQLFMCKTLAKRMLSLTLVVAGVPDERITELTGLCARSVHTLKKVVESGDVDSLLTVGGGGRKQKLVNVESEIIEEINNNNYHSRQQIADMVHEKYQIKVSVSTIGRLLKKTASNA